MTAKSNSPPRQDLTPKELQQLGALHYYGRQAVRVIVQNIRRLPGGPGCDTARAEVRAAVLELHRHLDSVPSWRSWADQHAEQRTRVHFWERGQTDTDRLAQVIYHTALLVGCWRHRHNRWYLDAPGNASPDMMDTLRDWTRDLRECLDWQDKAADTIHALTYETQHLDGLEVIPPREHPRGQA